MNTLSYYVLKNKEVELNNTLFQPGQSWSFVANCTEYMCVENANGGLHVIQSEGYTCPVEEIPVCPPCHTLESYVDECCPKFRCSPLELCCDNDVGKLVRRLAYGVYRC